MSNIILIVVVLLFSFYCIKNYNSIRYNDNYGSYINNHTNDVKDFSDHNEDIVNNYNEDISNEDISNEDISNEDISNDSRFYFADKPGKKIPIISCLATRLPINEDGRKKENINDAITNFYEDGKIFVLQNYDAFKCIFLNTFKNNKQVNHQIELKDAINHKILDNLTFTSSQRAILEKKFMYYSLSDKLHCFKFMCEDFQDVKVCFIYLSHQSEKRDCLKSYFFEKSDDEDIYLLYVNTINGIKLNNHNFKLCICNKDMKIVYEMSKKQ